MESPDFNGFEFEPGNRARFDRADALSGRHKAAQSAEPFQSPASIRRHLRVGVGRKTPAQTMSR
jgi:hypothetical protein